MSEKNALVIFQKNLIYGTVKTRLAATIGNDKAIDIYKQLLHYTHNITTQVTAYLIIYYSDYIETVDKWRSNAQKQIQHGFNLGERMQNAFSDVLNSGYTKAVIIGTDCPELTEQIIENAFEQLVQSDVVIGPAADGGYYLLGLKQVQKKLFTNISWSTKEVLAETIKRCHENHLGFSLLPVLHDVDEEQDLQYMKVIL